MSDEKSRPDTAPVRTTVLPDGDTETRGRVVIPPAPAQTPSSTAPPAGGSQGSSQGGSGTAGQK